MKKPELLLPAGDFSRLKYAIAYGADAVYIGGEEFSLRTASGNFSDGEMAEAVKYAHSEGVKVYVAVNTTPHEDEIKRYPAYLKKLVAAEVDAIIVGDIGLVGLTRHLAPEMKIHLSTQANAINSAAIRMWHSLGVSRVVLARECSIEEISEIRKNTPPDLEIEAFVHGAMCMAHSGRCLLSSYLTGRDANRGNCAQACRWKYSVCEETRPGEYYPVDETENGTYIFNSKDLCMIEHLDELVYAGVSSFKIEGRVKTEYYVSCAAKAYREAIDDVFDDLGQYKRKLPKYLAELSKTSHRDFSTGFYYGRPNSSGQNYETSGYVRDYELIGVIRGYDYSKRMLEIEQRNKFVVGDDCEITEPGKEPETFTVTEMYDGDGRLIAAAPHAQMKVFIKYPHAVSRFGFVRRKK